jgi:hypothetical protein
MYYKKAVSHWETIENTVVYCCFQKDDMTPCSAILVYTLQLNHPFSKANVTAFQVEFLSVKIPWHSFSIRPMRLTGKWHCIFPVCKLLHKSREGSKLSILYANHDHPCHVTLAFVVVTVNFHVVQMSI